MINIWIATRIIMLTLNSNNASNDTAGGATSQLDRDVTMVSQDHISWRVWPSTVLHLRLMRRSDEAQL